MKALITAIKLATLTFAISISMAPGTALALPKYDRVVTYYESPTGGEVGGHMKTCTGVSASWGEVTPYFSVFETLCSDYEADPCAGWTGAPHGYECPFAPI
jgi:hypothetical protein